jgi:hypothetical protein
MLLLVSLLLLVLVAPVWADPATHGLPNMQRQLQVWMGDHSGAHVRSGCLPTVPSSSLSVAPLACEAYAMDPTTGELLYIAQPAEAVTLSSTAGEHWLAVHRDTSTVVSGWTREVRTHYLHQVSASPPADPPGGTLAARLTVAGGVITAIADFRTPRSSVQRGVFDVSDPLYGASPTGTPDATAAIQAAEDARSVQAKGGTLAFGAGTFTVSAPIMLKSGGTVEGVDQSKSIIMATNVAGDTFRTTGASGFPARLTFRNLTLAGAEVKTAGAAILATTTTPTEMAQQQLVIENIWCMHHFTCFNLSNSIYAHITNNMLEDVRGTGIIVNTTSNPDAGDNIIAHNVLAGGVGATGMLIQTGGQRIIANKILAFNVGIWVNPISTTIPLIDLMILGNSIENQRFYGILIETPLVGSTVHQVHVVSNQFAGLGGVNQAAYLGASGQVGPLIVSNNAITLDAGNVGVNAIMLTENLRGEWPNGFVVSGNLIDGANPAGSSGIRVSTVFGSYRGLISGNYVTGLAVPYVGGSGVFSGGKATFAQLAAFGEVGSVLYCTDCQVTSGSDNTCAAGGTGALVVWVGALNIRRCFALQN